MVPQNIFYLCAGICKNSPVLEIWPNDNADCILFYPGTMTSPRHYITFLASLHRAGLTVAGIHLPGHGLNMSSANFTFADLLHQGLLAEQWLLDNGFGKIAVCGHSQGGILTLAHAATSQNVKAAFAISTVFPQMEQAASITRFGRFAKQRELFMGVLRFAATLFPGLPIPLPFYLPISRILSGRKKPVLIGHGHGRYCYTLGFLASLFDAEISPNLHCPFHIFSARDDALFPPILERSVLAMIKAPHKNITFLDQGGHLAPMNPQISEFVARSIACLCAGMNFSLNLSAGITDGICGSSRRSWQSRRTLCRHQT